MPRKIRELRSQLRKAGFEFRPGKGSHGKWYHPRIRAPIVVSGNDGDDAQRHQEKQVDDAIRESGGRP
jgi:predicted RNA binding protein YcfA (HicA-like mRNA interferase family)